MVSISNRSVAALSACLVVLAVFGASARDRSLVVLPGPYGSLAEVRPSALATADFDGDGMPDLAVGYAGVESGAVVLHRGNVDALFPNSPEARQRRDTAAFVDHAFLPGARTVNLPFAVGFLGAGDFDNDGRADLVAGTRDENSLHFLRGDGAGGLSPAIEVSLGGRLVAMAVGDVNRADGVPDVVVSVAEPTGPALLVFESAGGAVHAKPETIRVQEQPTLLELAPIRGRRLVNIVAAAANELLVVEGRDRRPLLDAPWKPEVAPPRLQRLTLPSPIESLAWGDFLPDPRKELAVATSAGELLFFDLEPDDGALVLKSIEEHYALASGATLVPARVSGRATDDLLILDAAGGPVQVMGGLDRIDSQGGGGIPPIEVAALKALAYPDVTGRVLAILPMRLNADARPDLVLLQDGLPVPTLAITARQAVITVNSNLDATTAGDGRCALREAINNANANADTTGGDCAAGVGLDTIAFAIGGGGSVASIAVAGSSLPIINDSVVIDGTTQGCAAPPCIELNGTGAGAAAMGLRLSGAAGGNTVRGLAVNRFTSHGIYGTTSGNIIEGNRLGTDSTGMVDQGNGGAGIRFQETGAAFNTIGGKLAAARNLASGNTGNGIFLFSGASDNAVLGNHCGVNAAGSSAIPNGAIGIELEGATSNTVGGSEPGEGNVTSGNGQWGIFLDTGSNGNRVLGNYVGVNPAGTTAIGNTLTGLYVSNASFNVIGGTSPGARNVVSGNGQSGIFIYNNSADNEVLGNHVGVDATGTVAIPNAFAGVAIQSAIRNTVGGADPGARNVLAGNGQNGVYLAAGADNNSVLGNHIGVDPTGATAIPNQTNGVLVSDASNTIGGLVPGARNVISGNLRDGVQLNGIAATGNVVSGNYIGVDASGTVAIGNGWNGVEMQSAPANTIGGEAPGAGNVIAASILYNGVMIGASDGTIVQGNLIGTDASGTSALGNQVGVRVYNSHSCTIGGTTPGTRNVISGNVNEGVHLDNSNSNTLSGNYIGTDITGIAAVPNRTIGVWVNRANDNRIGGAATGAGNVIAGNGVAATWQGILVETASTGNTIQGNLIGVDASGMATLGNAGTGVYFFEAGVNLVGGIGPGEGNVVAGNALTGVSINFSPGVIVHGNAIGTNLAGSPGLGNGGAGVRIRDSSGAEIGGIVAGTGNSIADNGSSGVIVVGTSIGGLILGNAIAGNGLLGIELGEEDGVTPNDSGDADTGPNDLQNFPVLTSVQSAPSGVVAIAGTLDGTPASSFRIEFFSSGSCDSTGYGEGGRFLGSTDVVTDGAGVGFFSASLTAPVQAGEMVTATATSPTNCTSEFSACAVASCSSSAVFPQTGSAPDSDHLAWDSPADVRWVKGDLAALGSYSTLADGVLLAASGLDISADQPPPQSGLYYLVRPLICGSWQSSPGGEPGRDSSLP